MGTTTALQLNKSIARVLDQVLREGNVTVTHYGKPIAEMICEYDAARIGENPVIPVNSTQIWRELPTMLRSVADGKIYAITRHKRVAAYLLPLKP